MSSEDSPREEVLSNTQEVIISEDFPIIQADSQSSSFNRLGKFVSKIGQNEWISQMDLFSTPMKLNYQREDCYKTEFGGLSFLTIAAICIFFTMLYQFPNGITFESPITYYTAVGNMTTAPSVFEHTDQFMTFQLYHKTLKREATDAQYAFLIKAVGMAKVTNGVATNLEMMNTGCSSGRYCFKKSDLNYQAIIDPNTFLHFQLKTCNFMDSNPAFGLCILLRLKFEGIIITRSFSEATGSVVPEIDIKKISLDSFRSTIMDGNQFTTNNNFMGHIANALPFTLSYYTPTATTSFLIKTQNQFIPSMNCSMTNPTVDPCTAFQFHISGSLRVHTQNFDDITAPILFFVSLIETLFFLIYFCCVKNYNNNAFHLKIADSIVYLQDGNKKHYNFKSGPAVFSACLLHNNFIIKIIDEILYRTCQTQIKRQLPLKAQLTVKMIDYGEKSLGEEMVFDQINSIYEQENLQPTKIIFEEEKQDEEVTEKQKQRNEEIGSQSEPYFDNKIDEQAFERLCKDHQYYSPERKSHLARLLKRHDKNYKLILQLQNIYQHYRQQVKQQYCSKEVELPVGGGQEDQSAIEIRKPNL